MRDQRSDSGRVEERDSREEKRVQGEREVSGVQSDEIPLSDRSDWKHLRDFLVSLGYCLGYCLAHLHCQL